MASGTDRRSRKRKALIALGAAALVPPAAVRGLAWRLRARPDPDSGEDLCAPVGEKSRYIESFDGSRLYTEEVGRGPAIVLSHGLFNGADMWHFQKKGLSDSYRLVCYDHRWHGRSDCPGGGVEALEALGRDLRAVLDACAPGEPVILAGHSMGGMAILKYCELFPGDLGSRVKGVALLDTAHVAMHEMMAGGAVLRRVQRPLVEPVFRFAVDHPGLSDGLKHAVIGTSLFLVAVRYLGFGGGASLAQMEGIGEIARRTSMEGASRACLALLGMEGISLEGLRRSGVPVLVWVGEKDRLTAPRNSLRLRDELPGSELYVISDTGHPSFMEVHEQFNRVLAEFADGALSAGGSGGTG